jgi:hypothetical protein
LVFTSKYGAQVPSKVPLVLTSESPETVLVAPQVIGLSCACATRASMPINAKQMVLLLRRLVFIRFRCRHHIMWLVVESEINAKACGF